MLSVLHTPRPLHWLGQGCASTPDNTKREAATHARAPQRVALICRYAFSARSSSQADNHFKTIQRCIEAHPEPMYGDQNQLDRVMQQTKGGAFMAREKLPESSFLLNTPRWRKYRGNLQCNSSNDTLGCSDTLENLSVIQQTCSCGS